MPSFLKFYLDLEADNELVKPTLLFIELKDSKEVKVSALDSEPFRISLLDKGDS
jgi:hypothetical protein